MTLEKTIFALLLTACLGFAAITWEESRANRASLEKAIASQQQIIDAAETREQSRDASLKTTLSQMASANKSVQTPQQIVTALQQFLDLPNPITLDANSPIKQSKPGKGSRQSKIGDLSRNPAVAPVTDSKQGLDQARASQSSSPDAEPTDCCEPAVVAPKQSIPATPGQKSEMLGLFTRKSHLRDNTTIPQIDVPTPAADVNANLNPDESASIPSADLKPLFDKLQICRSCEAGLAVSQADLNDEKTRSASLTKERDAALTSAKGGTFWHRLKQNAKWLAIGAAVTAGAIRIR